MTISNIALILLSIILLLFAFYSGMTIYSLLRFGKSRILGTVVSGIFVVLVIILTINAFLNLSAI